MQKTFALRLSLSLIAACFCGNVVSAHAQAPMPISLNHRNAMYSLPAVVRVFEGWTAKFVYHGKEFTPPAYIATGSGFFIHPNGYIVTNAHCVGLVSKGIDSASEAKEYLIRGFIGMVEQAENVKPGTISKSREALMQVMSSTQMQFAPIQFARIAGGADFTYEIKKIGDETGVGSRKDVAVLKIEVRDAPCLQLADSDTVQLVDHILVVGYPAAGDSNQLDDHSMLIASVTDGVVSAVKTSPVGSPILQVSAPSTHGNSGGPVVNDRGEVVGILTFGGNPVRQQEVSGFAFAVTANTIQEFVNETGIKMEASRTNELYRQGLDKMWAGDYAGARNYFTEVKVLFPQHSEVDRLITLASHNINQPRGGNPALLTSPTNQGVVAKPGNDDKGVKTNAKPSKPKKSNSGNP